ncbi:MAG: hypothetical protein LBM75_11400 [Myxococcales bacterium]|jgi:molecular chaperone DnaK (HSP70)|nr:hypothetical protein [Myxococcales bacterium]
MNEEVIGFDLGHGETALARVVVNDSNKANSSDEPGMLGIGTGPNKKNQTTAIGYYSDERILIGDEALRDPNICKSFIAFKKRPLPQQQDEAYEKLMKDYISSIYQGLVKDGEIREASKFIVGCPSEWTKDERVIEKYTEIFKSAGLLDVTVVSESRAALIQMLEKEGLDRKTNRSVLVIDVGSSTVDFTLLDLQEKNSKPYDTGRQLGAALIEKALFQHILEKQESRAELENIFSIHTHFRNRCEIACRQLKETYFSAQEYFVDEIKTVYAKEEKTKNANGKKVVFDPEIMTGPEILKLINKTPLVDLDGHWETWPQAFTNELIKVRKHMHAEGQSAKVDLILLTGGASRMGFIREKCKEIFLDSDIRMDDTPEFCIARGLARLGRIEIRTSNFQREIDAFCETTMRKRIERQIDVLYKDLAKSLTYSIIADVKVEFDVWRKGTVSTIEQMGERIDNKINALIKSESFKGEINSAVSDSIHSISTDLCSGVEKIQKKYGIETGGLINAFNGSSIRVGSISICSFISDLMWSLLLPVISRIASIVIGIIWNTISAILALLLGPILIATPPGWVILGALGITYFLGKGGVKEIMLEKMPGYDFPNWVRKLVSKDKVYSSINGKHSEIVSKIESELKKDSNLRKQLVDGIFKGFKKSLQEAADEAKLLID